MRLTPRRSEARPIYRWGALCASVAALLAPSSLHAQRRPQKPTTKHDHVEIESKLLGAPKSLCIYTPPGYDASGATRYPVLFYLHGLFNDSDRFFQEGLPEIANELIEKEEIQPLIIVCPTGDASFFVDKHDGSAPYEKHVIVEVREYVEDKYPVRADRNGRAIGGISMGGYAALKIAMKRPDLYGSTSGHTPFLVKTLPSSDRTDRRSQTFNRLFKAIFGDPIDMDLWKSNDPFELVARKEAAGLPIYFNSASRDRYFLNIEAIAFHKRLDELDIEHVYHPMEDVHGWVSLRPSFPEILAFHEQAFGPPAAAGGE